MKALCNQKRNKMKIIKKIKRIEEQKRTALHKSECTGALKRNTVVVKL